MPQFRYVEKLVKWRELDKIKFKTSVEDMIDRKEVSTGWDRES